MELKLGSVWLLLSCSLQQSLWGILASVPQTSARKCTHKISDSGEVRKVQLIKRIPARCSGWDEAWSWLSQKDCRTKYKIDYVELPRAVQKVEDKDCEPNEEEAAASESGNYFNVSDEKFLAIAFGSATVALLILILIIVVSLVRRGQICVSCCASPAYTTANVTERDPTDENQHACNAYVEEGHKLMESEYEEIMDPSSREKKQNEDEKGNRYQNLPLYPNDELKALGGVTFSTSNGTVIPSAPYEEDLHQTESKSVPNDYSAFLGDGNGVRGVHEDSGGSLSRFTPVGKDLVERNRIQQSHNTVDGAGCSVPQVNKIKQGSVQSPCVQNYAGNADELSKDTKKDCDDTKEGKKLNDVNKEKSVNEYSKFDDLIKPNSGGEKDIDNESLTDYEEPVSAHSYENLGPKESSQISAEYDSLVQSPVYCEPQTLTEESGCASSQGHVISNGFHDDGTEKSVTGSILNSVNDDSGINTETTNTLSNASKDLNDLNHCNPNV